MENKLIEQIFHKIMTCTKFRGNVTKWKVIESNLNTRTHYSKRDRDRPKSGYLMSCNGNNGERGTWAVKPERSFFRGDAVKFFIYFKFLGLYLGLHTQSISGLRNITWMTWAQNYDISWAFMIRQTTSWPGEWRARSQRITVLLRSEHQLPHPNYRLSFTQAKGSIRETVVGNSAARHKWRRQPLSFRASLPSTGSSTIKDAHFCAQLVVARCPLNLFRSQSFGLY